jgi:hypothetical protein
MNKDEKDDVVPAPIGEGPARPRASRTKLPGQFLVLIWVFNAVVGGLALIQGFRLLNLPAREALEKIDRSAARQLAAHPALGPSTVGLGASPLGTGPFSATAALIAERAKLARAQVALEAVKRLFLYLSLIGGSLAMLVGLVTVLGGVCMRKLRGYRLALVGAALAAVPGFSCLACVGLGEVVGVWAVVVLLQKEVRAAFQ